MITADMWWGQTWWPAEAPEGMTIQYLGGSNFQIKGEYWGPGCGNFSCGTNLSNFSFRGEYHLQIPRMPDRGCTFNSQPSVKKVSGRIGAETGNNALFDDPSAKCYLTLTQEVFSGVYRISVKRKYLQAVVIDDEANEWFVYDNLPDDMQIPLASWILDRSRPLQINVTVDFNLDAEGTGVIKFEDFTLNIPQWSIWSPDA